MGSESYDSHTEEPQATVVLLNEQTDILTLQKDSETDAQSDLKSERTDDDVLGGLLSRGTSEADVPVTDSSRVSVQFSLPKHLKNVLADVKAYVTQGDLYQVGCESEEEVSDSPKTKPLESTVDHPCYGEEAYSTIAGWIREPPVGSLEVRFTPHAERELAQFLPTHLSGKPLCIIV